MIRLWNSTETNFKGNLWVLNETTSANVTEITNGEFSLDLEYPLKDSKDLSKYFLRGNLITCPVIDDRPEQQFRIRKVDKTSNGVIIYAQAKLIADLSNNYIRPITLTGLTRKQAIQAVLNATLEPHSFIVGNLDTNTTNNVIVNIPEGTVLNALIGTENSILSEYGGEFIINNDTFDIVDSRGANRKFKISYGKNIASIKESIDDTDLATVLIPKSGDYRLPEYYIESPKVANYEKRYFKDVEFNLDIWDGEGEKGKDQITLAEAYALIRTTCNNMFLKDKIDQVAFNYAIDLISLRKTEEYKDYNIVEKVYIGDTVTVKHKLLNLDLEGKVNKTIYNVLLDKYSSVEIGFTKQDITDIINTAIKNIKFTEQNILLKVSNLDNTLTGKLEITATEIRSEVADTKKELNSTITQTATDIRTEVNDTKNGLQTSINQTASAINLRVDNLDKSTSVSISALEDSIENSVSKDNFSTLIKQNASSVVTAIHGETDNKVTIDSAGLTITDGGFIFEDSNGDRILQALPTGGIRIGKNISSTWYTNVMIGSKYLYELISLSNLIINDDLDMHRGSIDNVGDFYCRWGECNGNFHVDDTLICESLEVNGGSKNCRVTTNNYGDRLINAYETAGYFFGDIGSAIIGEEGCVYVAIDPIFLECVNTDCEYHIFTQIYDMGKNINKIDRFEDYFIVYGDIGTEFSWEIKAKRKGFENNRLELGKVVNKNETTY